MRWLPAVVLVTISIAGCLDGSDDAVIDPFGDLPILELPEDPMPEGDGHDHTDASQHRFLWNYDFSHRDPLMSNQAMAAGVHALDRHGDYLYGAVYGSHTASIDGGMVIWSLEDPAHPVEVGRFTIPGSVGGDRSISVTPDGNYVILGTEAITCFGHVNPAGVVNAYLIDVSDPTSPTSVDVVAGPDRTQRSIEAMDPVDPTAPSTPSLGVHSVTAFAADGQNYVALGGSIYRIDDGQFTYLNTMPRYHDMYVRTTPEGNIWGLTANEERPFRLFDLSDPEVPVEIAQWDLPDRKERAEAGTQYYMHTADVAFFEDQDIIVLTSEDWEDHVSPMWVLDATPLRDWDRAAPAEEFEPMQLEAITEWGNPGGHTATGVSFSMHNPRMSEDGIMTLSHYHGGLWQFDFREPGWRMQPTPIAYAVYAETNGPVAKSPVEKIIEENVCGLYTTIDAPNYMDVELGDDGILYAADVFTGLYTFVPSEGHIVYGLDALVPVLDADAGSS